MWEPPASIPTVDEIVRATSASVAGLDKQKRRLATVLRRHMIAARNDRPYRIQNVLIVGPTGGGKTWMIRNMLSATGCVFTEINATLYSETGYAGLDLSSCPIGFYAPPWLTAGDRRAALTPLAERWGVIVIDEFDKLHFKKDPSGRDTGRSVQAELLRIAEGDTVYARKRDDEAGTAFNTHNILFIAMGAFEGLSKLVDPSDPQAYMRSEVGHVVRYGFMEELIGRFSSLIVLPPLKDEHMVRIMNEHIVPRWSQQARDEGFTLRMDPDAVGMISNMAVQKGIGARGLEPLMEAAMWEAWGSCAPGQEVFLPGALVASGAVVRGRDEAAA